MNPIDLKKALWSSYEVWETWNVVRKMCGSIPNEWQVEFAIAKCRNVGIRKPNNENRVVKPSGNRLITLFQSLVLACLHSELLSLVAHGKVFTPEDLKNLKSWRPVGLGSPICQLKVIQQSGVKYLFEFVRDGLIATQTHIDLSEIYFLRTSASSHGYCRCHCLNIWDTSPLSLSNLRANGWLLRICRIRARDRAHSPRSFLYLRDVGSCRLLLSYSKDARLSARNQIALARHSGLYVLPKMSTWSVLPGVHIAQRFRLQFAAPTNLLVSSPSCILHRCSLQGGTATECHGGIFSIFFVVFF